MPFKRVWDTCCPHVWDSWEGDGATWVIRDIKPEEYDEVLNILIEHLLPDETLNRLSNFMEDPESIRSMTELWRSVLPQRMSIGCYKEKDGKSELVALNVCVVTCEGEKANYTMNGRAFNNVCDAIRTCDKIDVFKLFGVDKLLYGFGLVVCKQYRGAGLGTRLLNARKPLALHHGITASSTVFTGIGSQKNAERAGFSTAHVMTLKDLAEAGLDYPRDKTRCIKLMVKNYISD